MVDPSATRAGTIDRIVTDPWRRGVWNSSVARELSAATENEYDDDDAGPCFLDHTPVVPWSQMSRLAWDR